jgi:hypothetical protein
MSKLQPLSRVFNLQSLKRVRRACSRYLTPIASILTRHLSRSPLTTRGAILLLFSAYLLLGPVPNSSDIVAAALAYGLLTLLGVIASAAMLQALFVKRSLSIDLRPPDERLISGRAARCVIILSRIRLIPGMVLEVQPVSVHREIAIPTLRLLKGTETEHRITVDLVAPHRGNWDIHGVRCSLGDLTGFIRTTWNIPLETSLVVAPPEQPEALLPLISSTQRAGDLLADAVHRLGDPFDIKPYHPSDGVKKIVWKAFAKSGQLLSRHAEASMTPEGFVALFVLARTNDDEVCGKALAYINSLSELKLDLLLGCEGQGDRAAGYSNETSLDLLIDSTWDALESDQTSLNRDLQTLLDGCAQTGVGVNLRKIIIFCSGDRIAAPGGAELMRAIMAWMEIHQIEPVFFITQPRIDTTSERFSMLRRAKEVFFESDQNNKSSATTVGYQNFISECLARQWEVYT